MIAGRVQPDAEALARNDRIDRGGVDGRAHRSIELVQLLMRDAVDVNTAVGAAPAEVLDLKQLDGFDGLGPQVPNVSSGLGGPPEVEAPC